MLTIQILPSTIILEALRSQTQFHLLFTLMPLHLTVALLEQIFSTSTVIQYSLHPSSSWTHSYSFLFKYIKLLDFGKDDVYSALSRLYPSKATSIDTISPMVLKQCASSLTHPLCHLLNLSLSTGVIPQEWKVHLVVSVYKLSNQTSVKNYRLISLLCNT